MNEGITGNFKRDIHHGLRHSQDLIGRARILADMLGISEAVDWKVLTAAICLHDIFAAIAEDHGNAAAGFSEKCFSGTHLFSEQQTAKIKEAVCFHDKKSIGIAGKDLCLETKILYDIDNLDAFGIKGIYRYLSAYTIRGRREGRSDEEILGVIKETVSANVRRRYEHLYFAASRVLAEKEFPVALDFFEKLRSEHYDPRQVRAATGIFVLIARSPDEHPRLIAQRALAFSAGRVGDSDIRYIFDFFTALKSVYDERPAGEVSFLSDSLPDSVRKTLAAVSAIIEEAI